MPGDLFTIKQGDLLPAITEDLFQGDGTPADGSNCTARFHLRRGDGTVVIDAAAEIVTANPLRVRYQWEAGDTDDPGRFLREWELTDINSLPFTFPNGELGWPVTITPQIA